MTANLDKLRRVSVALQGRSQFAPAGSLRWGLVHVQDMTPVLVPEQLHLKAEHSAAAMVNGESQEPAYRLKAVINHVGHAVKSGHYTAQCRAGDAWYTCNDSKTVERNYVPTFSSQPYLVFYEKQHR